MAITHFARTIWSKNIMDKLLVECKLVRSCTSKYEGECEQAKTVKILGVGDPTVGKYDKSVGINVEFANDDGQELNIDQANYFAFLVDDIDKAQSVPGLPEEYQNTAVQKLAVLRDSYVAELIRGVTKNVTVADGLTETAVKNAIDDAIVELRERNFNEPGVIELSPRAYKLFKNNLITLSTDNPDYIARGIVGMYDGFEVVMSTNLAKDNEYVYCDIRGFKAIAFAGQINEVEAYRSAKYFADEVRGLDTFGAKVIDEDRIQVIKIPIAA